MSLYRRRVSFESGWQQLLGFIEPTMDFKPVSWMGMHETIYALCNALPASHADKLYESMKSFFADCVAMHRADVERHQSDVLEAYVRAWNRYHQGATYLNSGFFYLNKHWADLQRRTGDLCRHRSEERHVDIIVLALRAWRDGFFSDIKQRLVSDILKAVSTDRDGQSVRDATIRGAVGSFVHMGCAPDDDTQRLALYRQQLQEPYLLETSGYFQRESKLYLAAHTFPQYLVRAEERLVEEETRSVRFLDPSSYDRVRAVVEDRLMRDHLRTFASELAPMIQASQVADLSRMFSLLRPLKDGLQLILSEFEALVASRGLEQLRTAAQSAPQGLEPQSYVETLLDVHARFDTFVSEAFSSDKRFVASLDKACRKIVNSSEPFKIGAGKGAAGGEANASDVRGSTKAAEWLAKYADMLLRKNAKEMSDETDRKLERVVRIFTFLDNKDVFQKFYSKLLAKRLIHGTTASEESEGNVIALLRETCGYEFTSKLTRMFMDMSVSKDINAGFRDACASRNERLKVDFSVLVLQTGAWPIGASSGAASLAVPEELERTLTRFEEFYHTRFNGRKLTWLHQHSKVDVRMNGPKRCYDLQMTVPQMAVLLLFNDTDHLTLQDAVDATKMDEEETRRVLRSLVAVQLLLARGEGDWYSLNANFESRRARIKISTALQGEAPQEVEQTHRAVDEDRRLYLQATVVRIMKARKELSHVQLVDEVLQQCKGRFQPTVQLIKSTVEQLIDKQYLERGQQSRDVYQYVA